MNPITNPLDAIDAALAVGGRSFFNRDTPIGASVTGTVTSATLQQITDYVTKQPRTWDDGRPQQQVVITLETNLCDGPDDDGTRSVYIKTWGIQGRALRDAIRASGATRASEILIPGTVMTATLTGTTPSSMGTPAKVYAYTFQRGAAAGLDQALTQGAPTPAPQPAYQAPTPAPQPAYQAPTPAPDTDPRPTQARTLAATGLTTEQIAAALATTPTQVQDWLA